MVAAARSLIESGHIGRDDSVVLCNTGNGLKTKEALNGHIRSFEPIAPSMSEFEILLDEIESGE